ncbi:hypothetical protein PRNP1_009699 [Phytophthora ramorum]
MWPGSSLDVDDIVTQNSVVDADCAAWARRTPKNSAQISFWTWRKEIYRLVGCVSKLQTYDLIGQSFSEVLDAGEFRYFHHSRPDEGKNGLAFVYDETVLRVTKDVGIRIVLLNAYYEHGCFQRSPMVESQVFNGEATSV